VRSRYFALLRCRARDVVEERALAGPGQAGKNHAQAPVAPEQGGTKGQFDGGDMHGIELGATLAGMRAARLIRINSGESARE
jgi:hypothetical protein